jgi:hypothetical protein
MKNFKQLKVWQKGLDIAISTYQFAATLPKDEKFGLVSQITRAASLFHLTLLKEVVRAARKIIAGLSKFHSGRVLSLKHKF